MLAEFFSAVYCLSELKLAIVKQEMRCTFKRNIGARSRNHCCRRKQAIIITYCVCVWCVCVCVVCVCVCGVCVCVWCVCVCGVCVCVCGLKYKTCNAHAPYCIVICGLSGCTIFSTLSHKQTNFLKKKSYCT